MSISTFRDETINLRLTGGEDLESLLQPVGGNKSVESTVEFALPGGNKRDDDQDTTPPPVLVDHHVPSEALSTSARANDATLSERDDASDDDQVLPKRSYSADSPKKSDAAFDIFDESSDVDFLSATLPVKTSSHADESAGSEGENEESLPDKEAFSFEIKASKKRVSGLDVTANIASASSAPEGRESSPPSPTSSEDNVEIGKYSVSSVPSSRTPSVDDSIENLEETPLDDESMLGKVESHAFDSDWNQMQAKEKERKKRLQAKQRQAQRDKVIRKQGASSRSLTGSSAVNGSSIGKSKSGKKKKKNKDDAPSSSSHHKKSGSSRKHRHREKGDGNSAAPSEPPRSLTEL
ncbi:hypothetical protein KRP22_009010 [Phytophthora ramorum]|nr:hypothetical protein KRP22_7842 [Phytophthora ramorum]